MNFIVIIGVRKTATFAASVYDQQFRRKMETARHHQAWNFARTEVANALDAGSFRQTFQIGVLRGA